MAIELRNPLTITEETKIYGHNTVDIDGVPTDAGNGDVGQIVDIVDTKYIQGIKTDIDNIKAKLNGEIYRTQLVDANAYQIDVPSYVFPYAEVQKLKGKSVVWNQLFKNTNTSSNGITITNGDDGLITLNGTSTSFFLNFDDLLSYHNKIAKYFISFSILNNPNNINMQYGWLNRNFYSKYINQGRICHIWNQTSNEGLIYAAGNGIIFGSSDTKGVVFNNVKIKIMNINLTQMFGADNEPTLEECQKIFTADYYPYDAGTLKSFPVQRVKSVGKNLLNIPKLRPGDYNGTNSEIRVSIDMKYRPYILKGTKLSISFTPKGNAKNVWLIITDKNNNVLESLVIKSPTNQTATTTKDGYACVIFGGEYSDIGWDKITIDEVVQSNPQLEIGDITPYSPYMEFTIDLSSATTDMKSALSVTDEWQNGKVTKRVGSVDLGTLDYSLGTDGNGKHFFTTRINNFKSHTDSSIICKTLSKIFTPTNWNTINWTDATKNLIATYQNIIAFFYVPLVDSTDVNAFKSAMSGVMLYYELATPTEETVPLTEQFIDVESNGTLTFISDESVQMPIESTTKFVANLEEV